MKKLFLFALLTMATLTVAAQKGELSLGAGLSYGFNEQEVGVGMKAQYAFTQRFRGELAANYLIDTKELLGDHTDDMWDFEVNAHYLFPLQKGWTLYPLAGVACRYETFYSFVIDRGLIHPAGSHIYWGANLGAGIEKNLGKHWKINAELKGQMMKYYGQVFFGIGAAYRF